MSSGSGSEHFNSILTPALFARTASQGRWRMAPHLAAIDRAITDTLTARTADILLLEAPPRHGKSELISRYLPVWYLGTHPRNNVILNSYEATFAKSWGRKARDLMIEVGPALFGLSVAKDNASADEWAIEHYGGTMRTAGIGGPITGKGAHLLIIDDPVKNAEEALSPTIRAKHWDWWNSTAKTRREPGCVTIVMATRWHEDDLTGRMIKSAEAGELTVRRLSLPAIAEADDALGREPGEPLWPDRFSLDDLEQIRRSTDLYWWLAMYQQRPSRHGRAEWPDEYFDNLLTDEWPDRAESCVIAVDPSKGRQAEMKRGDYSAIVSASLARGVVWVDASIARRPPSKIVGDVIDFSLQYRPDHVGVESNAFQELLADEIDRQVRERGLAPLPVALIQNATNKELRISRIGPYLDRRHLKIRNTPGGRLLVEQLREFPLGDHDDGPDGLEMALRLLQWAVRPKPAQAERVRL